MKGEGIPKLVGVFIPQLRDLRLWLHTDLHSVIEWQGVEIVLELDAFVVSELFPKRNVCKKRSQELPFSSGELSCHLSLWPDILTLKQQTWSAGGVEYWQPFSNIFGMHCVKKQNILFVWVIKRLSFLKLALSVLTPVFNYSFPIVKVKTVDLPRNY